MADAPPQLAPEQDTEQNVATAMDVERVRKIITDSMTMRGLQPATIPVEEKRATLESWGETAQGILPPRNERLVWPVHKRVERITSIISGKLQSLTAQEARMTASDFSRVPASILPVPVGKDYVLASAPQPGWTGKPPTEPAPFKIRNIRDGVTASLSLRGIREAAADWRATLSHSSVLGHTIDTLDRINRSEDNSVVDPRVEEMLEVARLALDRVMITSAKHVANNNLYERRRMQDQYSEPDHDRLLSDEERASCRLGPMDSGVYMFGSQRDSIDTLVNKKRQERRVMIQADPLDLLRGQRPFQAGGGGRKPAAPSNSKGGGKGKGGKGKSKSDPKPSQQDSASKSAPAKSAEPAASKAETEASSAPRRKRNKKSKKGEAAQSKQ